MTRRGERPSTSGIDVRHKRHILDRTHYSIGSYSRVHAVRIARAFTVRLFGFEHYLLDGFSALQRLDSGRWHGTCFCHLEKWNADRDRFLADGGGCQMQELRALLYARCASEEV